jgi:hypothetical protein
LENEELKKEENISLKGELLIHQAKALNGM